MSWACELEEDIVIGHMGPWVRDGDTGMYI